MAISYKNIWRRVHREIFETRHITSGKKVVSVKSSKFKWRKQIRFVCPCFGGTKNQIKKLKYRIKAKRIYDKRPKHWLTKKERFLAVEMLGIMIEKSRVAFLIEAGGRATKKAKRGKIPWHIVYDIQKDLKKSRERLKYFRNKIRRDLHSYSPHRVAKILSVNREVIYRVYRVTVKTGLPLFKNDRSGTALKAKTGQQVIETRTYPRIENNAAQLNSWTVRDAGTDPLLKALNETRENTSLEVSDNIMSILDPDLSLPSESENITALKQDQDIWRFVTCNHDSNQTEYIGLLNSREKFGKNWFKRTNRDMMQEHIELSGIGHNKSFDYFRTDIETSDIPFESYVYRKKEFTLADKLAKVNRIFA